MILSCDPPRHAFLVHLGRRQQPGSIETTECEYHGARVGIALNRHSVPPSLVAIHFVRHGFRLPFIGARGEFSADYFHLQSGRRHNRFVFHFSYNPTDCQEWEPIPGITVLVSGPPRTRSCWQRDVEDRSVLHGLVVDLAVFNVDVDMTEFAFEFGADNLKDVPVTLFVE